MNVPCSILAPWLCVVAVSAVAAATPVPSANDDLTSAEGVYKLDDGRRARVEVIGTDALRVTVGRQRPRTIRAGGYGTFVSTDGEVRLRFPDGPDAGLIKMTFQPAAGSTACAASGNGAAGCAQTPGAGR